MTTRIQQIVEREQKANEGFKGVICRGSYVLGSACKTCERCRVEFELLKHSRQDLRWLLAEIERKNSALTEIVEELKDASQDSAKACQIARSALSPLDE